MKFNHALMDNNITKLDLAKVKDLLKKKILF